MLEGEKFEANKMLAPVIKEILEPHKLIYASSATLENLVFSLLCLVHGSLLAGGDVSDTVLLSDNHLFSKLFRQSSPSTRAIIGKPAKPFFSASQVFSSLRILASIVGVRSIDQLFDANLILRVLNIYSEHVDCLVFPDSVCRVMDGLKLLFAICPKILLHVVPLRWLISILLRIIKRGGVPLKEGCSFILCVCKYAIESDHSHSLAPSLVLIITSLAQFMHHEIRRTSNLEEECRILSKTVIQLIQSSYKLEELNIEVQISMAQLDPDEALFDDIRESFNKMRASIAGEGGRGDGNNNIQVIQKLVTVANDFTNSKTALLATLKYIKSALRFGLSAFSSEKYLCIEICQYLIGIIHSHPKGELCHLALSCLGISINDGIYETDESHTFFQVAWRPF